MHKFLIIWYALVLIMYYFRYVEDESIKWDIGHVPKTYSVTDNREQWAGNYVDDDTKFRS